MVNHITSETEPPLSNPLPPGSIAISIVFIFLKTLIVRIGNYSLSVFSILINLAICANSVYRRTKRFILSTLMYKGGYFHHPHRLGVAAITSTTVFSVFLVPISNPIQEIISFPLVLSTQSTDEYLAQQQVDLVLQNSIRSINVQAKDMHSEVLEYTIEDGDTISTIAEKFLVSVEALRFVNELSTSDLIHPGNSLTIPPVGGLIHSVKQDETVSSIAELYSVSPQAIVDFNHLEEPFVIHSADELVIPDAKVPIRKPVNYFAQNLVGTSQVAGLSLETLNTVQSGTGGFTMPAAGTISQYFWWGHTAIDLAGSGCGTAVVAADSGTITFAGWWPGGGGNSIFIDHGNGYVTKYAHLSGFERTGGGVNRGDVVGYVGATGRAFGCHLHFIVESNGRPIDPLSVL